MAMGVDVAVGLEQDDRKRIGSNSRIVWVKTPKFEKCRIIMAYSNAEVGKVML
jgi:hypothetical protein